jgi:hypothetical protein
MADEVQVITEAVLDEAKKWRDLSAKLAPIKKAVDGLTLAPTAFFVGLEPSFMAHSQSYEHFRQFMADVLAGGVTEFDQLGGALDKIAKEYDKADAIVSLDLNKIYTA